MGIHNGDSTPIGTNSFMYRQSLLRVQTLSGHMSCFLYIVSSSILLNSLLFTVTLGQCTSIMLVCVELHGTNNICGDITKVLLRTTDKDNGFFDNGFFVVMSPI